MVVVSLLLLSLLFLLSKLLVQLQLGKACHFLLLISFNLMGLGLLRLHIVCQLHISCELGIVVKRILAAHNVDDQGVAKKMVSLLLD